MYNANYFYRLNLCIIYDQYIAFSGLKTLSQPNQKSTLMVPPFWGSLVLFLVLSTAAFIVSDAYLTNQKNTYLESVYKTQQDKMDIARFNLSEMARFSYESIILNNDIVSLLKQASQGDSAQQEIARNKLYKALLKDYKWLKSHNVRQLHFQLPEGISFLRFHRPTKFGDSLKGVRYGIDLVNQTQKPVFGFEEGRIFNGFRHIFPLFFHNEFVGSVEVSYGLDAISRVLNHKGKSSEVFILSSNIVKQKLFKEELSNYADFPFGDAWLLDKEAAETSIKMNKIPRKTIDQINLKVKDLFIQDISQDKTRSGYTQAVKLNDEIYTISFLPIYNTQNQKAGYILSYEQDTFLPNIYTNETRFQVIILLLIITLSVLVYIFLKIRLNTLRKIQRSAIQDDLTGIYNRKGYSKTMPNLLEHAQKYNEPLGMIFFDVDHFKKFNDNYGHSVGDEVLVTISHLVTTNLREPDFFSRWGGEEFIVVIPNTDLERLTLIAEKLRIAIQNHKFTQLNLHVTSSFGITMNTAEDDEKTLLNRADQLLYKAKEKGRNIVVSDSNESF